MARDKTLLFLLQSRRSLSYTLHHGCHATRSFSSLAKYFLKAEQTTFHIHLQWQSTYLFIFQVDSYSAFFDNGGFSKTELDDKLRNLGVDTLYITGLALDFCVFYSAMDATHLNYTTYVVLDATRGITPEGIEEAKKQMKENGVKFLESLELPINGQITSIPCVLSLTVCFLLLKYIGY